MGNFGAGLRGFNQSFNLPQAMLLRRQLQSQAEQEKKAATQEKFNQLFNTLRVQAGIAGNKNLPQSLRQQAGNNMMGIYKSNAQMFGIDPASLPDSINFAEQSDAIIEASKQIDATIRAHEKGDLDIKQLVAGIRDAGAPLRAVGTNLQESTGFSAQDYIEQAKQARKASLSGEGGNIQGLLAGDYLKGVPEAYRPGAETAMLQRLGQIGGETGEDMLSKVPQGKLGAGLSDTQLYTILATSNDPKKKALAQSMLEFRRAQPPEAGAVTAAKEGAKADVSERLEFNKTWGKSTGEHLFNLKVKADDAVASVRIISEGKALLNRGAYTGSAADIKLTFNKWLQEAGVHIGDEKAANTEAYAGLMGKMVGKVIKDFGSGTGLSDADRAYAEKIAAGKITMSEASIRKLLDINERLAFATINFYNRNVSEAKRQRAGGTFLNEIETSAQPRPEAGGTTRRLKYVPGEGLK